MAKNNRCVVEIYRGIEIRNSNVIRFRVGANKFKEIIDEVFKTNLSMPKIISISGKPCEKCKGIEVRATNGDGEEVLVKRGILSDYTMQNNGSSIKKTSKKIIDTNK
jgi:hypothetical protein